MKSVCLQVVDEFNYREQLLNLVKSGGEKGVDFDEMKRRLRLLDVLEPAQDREVVQFEDADHELLVSIVKNARWLISDRKIVYFIEAVTSGQDSLPQL